MNTKIMSSAAVNIPRARWLRIIPPMIIIYIVAYMDRMSIAFAMAGGMSEELGMNATVSGLAAGIFFVGYLLLQVQGGKIAETRSAKKFILYTIIGWGGISFMTGFVQNETQLLIARFLLGVAEGGIWPAILVSIANWFPEHETSRANAFFMSSLALGAVITGPVSGWIVSAFDWRWIFFIEGGISLLLIFIWVPLFCDRPEEAKWISPEEREYLVKTIAEEKARAKKNRVEIVSLRQLMGDKNLWLLTTIYFCNQVGQYGFLLWLPTVLKSLTSSGMTIVGLLSAVPYIAALVGLYIFSALADRKRNRRLWTSLTTIGFGVSCMLAALFTGHVWLSYAFIVLTGMFTKVPAAIFWVFPRTLFAAGAGGTARGFINAVANIGGFLGPLLVGWVSTMFSMQVGFMCLVAFLMLGAALCWLLPASTSGKDSAQA